MWRARAPHCSARAASTSPLMPRAPSGWAVGRSPVYTAPRRSELFRCADLVLDPAVALRDPNELATDPDDLCTRQGRIDPQQGLGHLLGELRNRQDVTQPVSVVGVRTHPYRGHRRGRGRGRGAHNARGTGLQPALPLLHLELHEGTRQHEMLLNKKIVCMQKNIVAAIVGRNESITTYLVEPKNLTCTHDSPQQHQKDFYPRHNPRPASPPTRRSRPEDPQHTRPSNLPCAGIELSSPAPAGGRWHRSQPGRVPDHPPTHRFPLTTTSARTPDATPGIEPTFDIGIHADYSADVAASLAHHRDDTSHPTGIRGVPAAWPATIRTLTPALTEAARHTDDPLAMKPAPPFPDQPVFLGPAGPSRVDVLFLEPARLPPGRPPAPWPGTAVFSGTVVFARHSRVRAAFSRPPLTNGTPGLHLRRHPVLIGPGSRRRGSRDPRVASSEAHPAMPIISSASPAGRFPRSRTAPVPPPTSPLAPVTVRVGWSAGRCPAWFAATGPSPRDMVTAAAHRLTSALLDTHGQINLR
ncbi:exported hypothetical protein [Frankia sp. AiPs1]